MKKCVLSLCLALSFVCTMIVPASATSIEDTESTFRITVMDEQGNAIDSATVSLYSYLDKGVVLNSTTNNAGKCVLKYMPDIDVDDLNEASIEQGSNETLVYADYIVYASKDGYQDEVYTLTKLISPSGEYNFDAVNQEEVVITLKPESAAEISMQSVETMNYQQVYQYLVTTGKVSDECPIYVIQPEDRVEMEQLGITSPVIPYATTTAINNVRVPIGEFHVTSGGKVNVTFQTSDSLTVQTKADAGSGWSVSGSIKRNFAEKATYATFTTTSNAGQKKTYYVMGDFVKEESYTVGGNPRTTIRLDRLRASTATGTAMSCTKCMKSYSALSNSDGLIREISAGSSITVENAKSIALGLYASAGGVNLGVTRNQTASSIIKYSSSGKNLKLYDNNTNEAVYHMTQK